MELDDNRDLGDVNNNNDYTAGDYCFTLILIALFLLFLLAINIPLYHFFIYYLTPERKVQYCALELSIIN